MPLRVSARTGLSLCDSVISLRYRPISFIFTLDSFATSCIVRGELNCRDAMTSAAVAIDSTCLLRMLDCALQCRYLSGSGERTRRYVEAHSESACLVTPVRLGMLRREARSEM